jgi:rhodanese-related sulfurtransferase
MIGVIVRILLGTAAAFGLAAVAWTLFETWWDQRLFGPLPDGGFAKNIRTPEAATLLETEPLLQILDLRSAREAKSGTLPNAIRISSSDDLLTERLRTELDSAQPVLVYCAGGFRSRRAIPLLKEAGFRHIYHLHRGLLGAGATLKSSPAPVHPPTKAKSAIR